jgi:tRNA (guanine37-N1)-methyltransferase
MKFSVLSIHPDFFYGFCREALIGKAIRDGKLSIDIINPRDFSDPPHFRVDDKPYGGGPGMVMKPEPLARALNSLPQDLSPHVIVLSAKGKALTQAKVRRLAKQKHIVLICGRYEGIDQRIIDHFADEELSVGPYVLMGGEAAAQIVMESVARFVPGVLGNQESLEEESFSRAGQREHAQYTRPPLFEGHAVPDVLQSGDHKKIERWRKSKS